MPDAPLSPNEATFTQMIKPITTRCLGSGCHGTSLGPNLTSYSTLSQVAKYTMKPGSTNILVTKGNHAGITYLDAGQIATMTSWIDGLQ